MPKKKKKKSKRKIKTKTKKIRKSFKSKKNRRVRLKKNTKLDLIESGDNFLLYNIKKEYDRTPDLNDQSMKSEIIDLIYQKGKFDYNRKLLEEIQNNEFNNTKFEELSKLDTRFMRINSIKDDDVFEINSVKMLYSLPVNSFTLVGKFSLE